MSLLLARQCQWSSQSSGGWGFSWKRNCNNNNQRHDNNFITSSSWAWASAANHPPAALSDLVNYCDVVGIFSTLIWLWQSYCPLDIRSSQAQSHLEAFICWAESQRGRRYGHWPVVGGRNSSCDFNLLTRIKKFNWMTDTSASGNLKGRDREAVDLISQRIIQLRRNCDSQCGSEGSLKIKLRMAL